MGKYSLTWELGSLYPNPETEEFRSIVDRLKQRITEVADLSDALPSVDVSPATVETWAGFVADYAGIAAEYNGLIAFVECHAAADAANKVFLRYEGELSALSPVFARLATNVEFAFQSASDETFSQFLDAHEALSEVGYFLELRRRNAALRLPREQELLAAELDVDGLHAWGRLYDRISGELRVDIMEKGEIISKSPGQVDLDSPERSVRQNNFFAADKAWRKIADTCADAINHIAGSRLSKYRRLGIDHLEAPLQQNHMQRKTLDTMWSVVSDRKSCLVDYLQAKSRLLGLEGVAAFDLQAPLPSAPGEVSSKLSYDEACTLTIDAFNEFNPELGEFAQMAIENCWIEVENREGKRQGGFCTDITTRKQSRIFMTFTDSIDSMSTLAHELGHAYHTWVLRDQPLFLRDYPMNLAETASTFAEAVLGENRLAACESTSQKLVLLDKLLADSVAFLMNIHARFIFEDNFHQERHDGEVSAERLSDLMLAAQKEAYCDALVDDGWYPNFWMSKLHFYITGWPFYNFPYTFGYLLSQGTFSLAKDSAEFPQQFRDFLVATGSRDTEDAVRESFGFDLREPDFWNRSLDAIEQRAREFVALAS